MFKINENIEKYRKNKVVEKIFGSKILEIMLVIYFSVCSFEIITSRYIDSILLTIINLYVIFKIIYKYDELKVKKNIFKVYIILVALFILIIITICFTTSDLNLILIRTLRLGSFLQLYLLFSMDSKFIDYKNIIKVVINIFYYISFICIVDFIIYKVFRVAVWPPMDYVGFRYSGPFQDPNYLNVYYSIMLILALFYNKELLGKNKIYKIIMFTIMIGLGKSWSAIILIIMAFLGIKVMKFRNLFLKTIIIGGGYILFIDLLRKNLSGFKNFFVNSLLGLGVSEEVAMLKFNSLAKRFDVQFKVLENTGENAFGMGVRGVINAFKLDTHNSWFSILGDLGIIGLILLFVTFMIRVSEYNAMIDLLSSYLLLQCLFIDLFFTNIYWFVIFVIVFNGVKELESLKNINLRRNKSKCVN